MDCLTMLLNFIYAAFEQKQVVVVVFLDIRGAFDNVNIDILCARLRAMVVPVEVVKMIWAMMSERTLVFEDQHGESF